MTEDGEMRIALAAAIEAHPDYNPTSLARAIGRDGTYIRDFLKGKKASLGAKEVAALEAKLGVTLLPGDKQEQPRRDGLLHHRPPPALLGERDFPLFVAAEGGIGDMVVTSEVYEWVQRPWYMREVKDGYGVLVVGESMDPAFKPGDIAIVNPKLPLMRGRNAIFVAGEDRGEFKATIKELQRWDATTWHVRQHNPPGKDPPDFTLDRRTWPKALRVVGKFEGS